MNIYSVIPADYYKERVGEQYVDIIFTSQFKLMNVRDRIDIITKTLL